MDDLLTLAELINSTSSYDPALTALTVALAGRRREIDAKYPVTQVPPPELIPTLTK